MRVVKKTETYIILSRNDGRYAVIDASKNPINGAEKVRILVDEELITAFIPEDRVEPQQSVEEQNIGNDDPVSDDSSDAAEQSEVHDNEEELSAQVDENSSDENAD